MCVSQIAAQDEYDQGYAIGFEGGYATWNPNPIGSELASHWSDGFYAGQQELASHEEKDEPEQFLSDAEADADVLASAGMGTDEDYGLFDGGDSADEFVEDDRWTEEVDEGDFGDDRGEMADYQDGE